MSPRRIRREPTAPQPEPVEQMESWPDGDWVVRRVSGAAATKAYRCPGCDQEILRGVPHVVAWPADAQPFGMNTGVGERRHWHSTCWQRRLDRRPARRAGPGRGRLGR